MESFWWGLMTITTVGYDLNPRTYLGKLIGGFTAISGIFILTLPIPIVVNSFASYYKVRSQVHLVNPVLNPTFATQQESDSVKNKSYFYK